MSKGKRDKTDDSIYHVMCRSISEVDLFNADIEEFIKRYSA